MNCLNRIEIQRYIDGEISLPEKKVWEEHLRYCTECKMELEFSKKEVKDLRLLLDKALPDFKTIEIPDFKKPESSNSVKLWMKYVSAASILMVLGLTWILSVKQQSKERSAALDAEINLKIYDADANKLWNEKTTVITITDKNGHLIYSSLND